jgi:hypothetical protein
LLVKLFPGSAHVRIGSLDPHIFSLLCFARFLKHHTTCMSRHSRFGRSWRAKLCTCPQGRSCDKLVRERDGRNARYVSADAFVCQVWAANGSTTTPARWLLPYFGKYIFRYKKLIGRNRAGWFTRIDSPVAGFIFSTVLEIR